MKMDPKIGYDDDLVRSLTKRFNRELATLRPLIEALNEMAETLEKTRKEEEKNGDGEES